MGINPYNYNTLMAKVRDATVKLTAEVKAVATRALGRAEEAYEYAEEAGRIADIANRLAEDIIYTHLQYDENATYSKMVYGINILGQEPENWLQDKRYNTITGELENYDNRICTDELISVTPGAKYIFSTYDCKGYIKQLRVSIVCYDSDEEYVGYLPDKTGMFTVTIPSNTAKIGVTIFTNEPASSFTILTSIIGISIFPWSVTPLEEDTDATYVGMYSSNEQEIPDDTDPASYIWKAIKTTEEGFTPIIPGTGEGEQGPPGPPGEPGAAGVSITRTVFEYAVNNSTTTPPTSGWSETQSDVTTENPVLWQRIKTSYSDGTTQYTGTIPSIVFQRIVTFINAAQSGEQGTVINGGAITTNTITVDKIIKAPLVMGDSAVIDLSTGKFDFHNADNIYGITWDGSHLSIQLDELVIGGFKAVSTEDIRGTAYYTDGIHTDIQYAYETETYFYEDDQGVEHIVPYSDLLDINGNPIGDTENAPFIRYANGVQQSVEDLQNLTNQNSIRITEQSELISEQNTAIGLLAQDVKDSVEYTNNQYHIVSESLANYMTTAEKYIRFVPSVGLEVSDNLDNPQRKIQITDAIILFYVAGDIGTTVLPYTVKSTNAEHSYLYMQQGTNQPYLLEAKSDGSIEFKVKEG